MMRATNLLLTVLAVASLAAAGCGGDTKDDKGDTTSTAGDTTVTTGDTTVTTTPDTTADTDGPNCTSICGGRECGNRSGCNCGACDPGETCSAAGQCEAPGAPLGSFCGITATCEPSNTAVYPDCLDKQCASRNCLSNNQSAFLLRDVCSAGCTISKDDDDNGVNDADAPNDTCNPTDIVDGPAGNLFRCVNFSAPGDSPLGLCVPGTEFEECASDLDCPSGEGCELTTIGGNISFRCVGKYIDNDSWNADVVGLSETCNDDPESGPVAYCASGLCFGIGCVSPCDRAATDPNAGCDTTKVIADTGCDTAAHTCKGNAAIACTKDIDCSSWECGEPRQIFSNVTQKFDLCWPKGCTTDDQCGGGFYCRFFWNGEEGDAAGLDSLCLPATPGGAELGEACDPNPDDNVPGDTCKDTDLCIGGFCSNLCLSDADCATSKGQLCAVAELPGDADDDGETDFALAVQWCQTYPGATGNCRNDSDCAATETCDVYEVANPDANGKDDAPYLLAGKCVPVSATDFPGETGTFGQACNDGSECRSGFCLGATETESGFCTKTCADTPDCGSVNIGGETARGVCSSLLFGWGGDFSDNTNAVFIPLCVLTDDTLADCSDDLSCDAANEVCLVNTVATDAAHAPKIEYLCEQVVDEGTALPTGAVGSACNPNPGDDDALECANAYCQTDRDGNGYCTKPCDGDSVCGNGTTCTQANVFARVGEYADNSGSVGFCLKPSLCEECYGNFDCNGDFVCANVGSSTASNYRCVPKCETAGANSAECGGTTSCTAGADQRGEASLGCYNKAGTAASTVCTQ